MLIKQIFDSGLAQYAYLIGCQKTGEAIIIDPERDIDRYVKIAAQEKVKIVAATETHIHADFVSGLQEFSADSSVKLYLSAEGGPDWSYRWPKRNSVHFVRDKDKILIGDVQIEILHTPGHTPEHISFVITDLAENSEVPAAIISGDLLFVGDVGRPDLLETASGFKNMMESSAAVLQHSLKEKLQPFEDLLKVFPGHGAGSACGKSLGSAVNTTLGSERQTNEALRLAISGESSFVKQILSGQANPPLYFERMRRVNKDGLAITGGVPVVKKISVAEFINFTSAPSVKVLDTRNDREAFDTAHAVRAINAPLSSTFFSASAGSYLSSKNKIILTLEAEADLDSTVRQLYRIGLDIIVGWIALEDLRQNGLLMEKIERIEFANFDSKKVLSTGEIIDVRNTSEYESGHMEEAKSFPYTGLRSSLDRLPKDKTLFVHCGSGLRAAIAASFLKSEGYEVVHVDGLFPSQKRQ